ncbi:MAG: hypothetical protein RL491_383, partial [Bacteroidota bacterium]
MHIKKNHLMMVLWILLLGFVIQALAGRFGIPYLFLDPEYLGNVDALSFFITGICCGMFIMAFNISSYILNSFRFPFLASLSKPFQKYTINNFIIPVSFLITYLIKIFIFQHNQQLASPIEIAIEITSFLIGVFIVVQLVLKYFLLTNKDIYKLFGVRLSDHEHEDKRYHEALESDSFPEKPRRKETSEKHWKVTTYLSSPLKARLVRDTSHYKHFMLKSVFRQNHLNAATLELFTIGLFIFLGLFRDFEVIQIPAAASLFLLFSMVMMVAGVIRFWMKAWSLTVVVIGFIIVNYISGFDLFNPESRLFGLDYNTTKPVYTVNNIIEKASDSTVNADIATTISILEKWKTEQVKVGNEKPKLCIVAVSGGGLRASLFTYMSLYAADSATQGRFFENTRLITGSSGGMVAASYYRSIKLEGDTSSKKTHMNRISSDMLNATTFSMIVSDLFLNIQKEDYKGNSYFKDRGHAFEKKLNRNLGDVLNKPLRHFRDAELNAKTPMTIFSPTIVNDGRSLYVSPIGVSYMINRSKENNTGHIALPDGIEFTEFFAKQHPEEARYSDLLRANATFPYIMPAVSLPTEPVTNVMDAGIRDNYGIRNATRFLYVFREWISANTSGVVLVQIRDNHKRTDLENKNSQSILSRLLSPLQNLSGNFLLMQDYSQDEQIQYVSDFLNCQFEYIDLEVPLMDEKVALSWHLTEQEKQRIQRAVYSPENKREIQRLSKLFPAS